MARRESERERRKVRKYMDRIEAAEKWRDSNYRDKWTRWYKMWRNIAPQLVDKEGKPVTDRSNLSIPYPFVMLETILPRLVETLFAGRPYVAVKGVPTHQQVQELFGPMGAPLPNAERPWVAAAERMQTLLDYQMNVPMDMQDLFHTGMKIMGLYGTTVSYTGWCFKERTVIRKELVQQTDDEDQPLFDDDNVTPIMDWEATEVSVKEYDDPEVKFLDLGLFFVDPNAEDIDDARYAGHVDYMSKEQLNELAANDDDMRLDWKQIPKTPAHNEARNNRMSAIGIPNLNETLDTSGDMDLYEVHKYFEDDRHVIIINRQYLAKDAPNPFYHKKKPYDKDVYSEDPKNFYGIGLMEMLEDLHAELNTERNQRIDYRSFSMRRPFAINRNAQIDRKQLKWGQGNFIEMDDVDHDLKVLNSPDAALAGSFNQETIIKEDMKQATGAHDVVMGTSTGGETATTTMSKDNNASMRFKLIISSVEKRLLVRIARKMMQLNQQFIEDIRLLPLFDKDETEWPQIAPEDIQGEFHLIAAGSSVEPMANKEAFKQRMVELYGVVGADPFMQQFPIKRRNLLKKLLESFDIQDTDDILPTDDELNGVMEQQMMQNLLARMPPEAQQLLQLYMQGGQPPMMPPEAPPPSLPGGGGANTAMQQEAGMQMAGAGG
ncbi:portal protein [Gorillibacterium sp. sgz5001074]|uniref:portal protein n=1 Tax=Gorillibacterium sp. sgz5001074 TaxID=3446695 RepID=UPI003F667C5F